MTIFAQILAGDIPADKIYEDDQVIAFRDVNPQAPTHVLVIPRKPLRGLDDATQEDEALLGRCLIVAARIARELGLDANGYRVVTNVGRLGGQSVFHLHFHLLGGRQLGWPPG